VKYLFGLVYVLVLATQLPHVWYSYASLESGDVPLAHVTALGAAIAFELATGIFTFRIVNGSRRTWTKRGLAFFIVASIVANGYYYGVWPFLFDFLMPVFAMLALPAALALFAEEFGTEVKREERAAKRAEREAETPKTAKPTDAAPALPFACGYPGCDRSFASQQALAGHAKAHTNGHKVERLETVAAGGGE